MSRFRPIVLTSITTVAGLAPLMLNKSFQAQFLIPNGHRSGVSVFCIRDRHHSRFYFQFTCNGSIRLHRSWVWIKRGDWPSMEAGEPANREEQSFEE